MKLEYKKACEINDYLLLTGQGFCFVQSLGRIVDKVECENVINNFNTL